MRKRVAAPEARIQLDEARNAVAPHNPVGIHASEMSAPSADLSGGQLQRACIARSMINNPKIIFADEPTGALNRSASDEVMEELEG